MGVVGRLSNIFSGTGRGEEETGGRRKTGGLPSPLDGDLLPHYPLFPQTDRFQTDDRQKDRQKFQTGSMRQCMAADRKKTINRQAADSAFCWAAGLCSLQLTDRPHRQLAQASQQLSISFSHAAGSTLQQLACWRDCDIPLASLSLPPLSPSPLILSPLSHSLLLSWPGRTFLQPSSSSILTSTLT